jgi:aryl-alcohol dehydrogenase-like predicted oxidoreductase
MKHRQLGSSGLSVSAIGLGCMGMSGMYGPADRADSIATIHAALEKGVTLLDTGDFYGCGHNEMLIGEALRTASAQARSSAVVSVKFGALRDPAGGWTQYDARPAAVKNFAAYSLQRLGIECIDIYRPARLDPTVPIEDTIGAIADLVKAGYVRHIGLSEMGVDTIRRAAKVHPICDLQIEYSVLSRGIENGILQTCRDLGIAITAYGVLSRGLISGEYQAGSGGKGDMRAHSPRFQPGNLEHNLRLVAALSKLAAEKGITVAQLAIAWVAAQGPDIVPLVGARNVARLASAIEAAGVQLNPAELEAIEREVPKNAAAGERYAAAQMAHLDSERASSQDLKN